MELKRIKRKYFRGFTLVEALFSLMICLLIVINFASILRLFKANDKIEIISSNFSLGANQISKMLFTAKDIEILDYLSYTNEQDEQFTISLNNHRVVKEPGFDIIIHDVDSLQFYQIDNNIYMEISRKEHDYTYLIACDYQIKEDEIESSEEIEN